MTKQTLGKVLLGVGSAAVLACMLPMPASAQRMHRGNWNTPEAKSCADFVEAKYNRRVVDRYDARKDSERAVEITFYNVAQVPQLFGGHKFVSMSVTEYAIEGDIVHDSRTVRNASYCVLDAHNRVIGLEYEMR
jgi:hypothetical protein